MIRWVQAVMRRVRKLFFVAMLSSLMLSAGTVLPQARDAARIFWWQGDPLLMAQFRLSWLPAARYQAALEQALQQEDVELALSLYQLAQEQGVVLDDVLIARLQEADRWQARMLRSAGDIWQGLSTGRADSAEGMAAAVITDLTLLGDLRDLTREGLAWPDHDPLLLALAGTGIGLSALSLASGGATVPARAGVSLLKVARKSGRMSRQLGEQLHRLSREAIDGRAARELGERLGRLELKQLSRAELDELALAAGRIVGTEATGQLASTGRAVRNIAGHSGARGAMDSLGRADSVRELVRLEQLSSGYRGAYRGVLRLLPDAGKGLYRLSLLMASLLLWLGSFLLWCLGVLWTLQGLLRGLYRGLFGRRTG
ncbi:hypothetical protein [Zobellella iuensis]|uniref:Uncharacterized protein n=1 Tax=Zobellella iuensis TaxID=2803811 RepID=A0ABS1QSS5_9GAMM|nr:hypothetical protein [Zobellella iuensis]MBL1377163.1 hypothetical protein [Zobellella iuensis]